MVFFFSVFNFPFCRFTFAPRARRVLGQIALQVLITLITPRVNLRACDKHVAVVIKAAALGWFPKQSWGILPVFICPKAPLRACKGTKRRSGAQRPVNETPSNEDFVTLGGGGGVCVSVSVPSRSVSNPGGYCTS